MILLRFLAVTSVNLACASSHSKQGLSPSAHRGNGATDLSLLRLAMRLFKHDNFYLQVHNTSRLNYFRYLFRTAFHTSHPFTLPFVQAVRVTDWEFVPQVFFVSSSSIAFTLLHFSGWKYRTFNLELWWRDFGRSWDFCQGTQATSPSICKVISSISTNSLGTIKLVSSPSSWWIL